MGVGSTQAAAALNNRRSAGAETEDIITFWQRNASKRLPAGTLRYRRRNTPVFDPAKAGKSLTTAPWLMPAA